MRKMKIGILTSGGDAPGMNSALFGAYSACVKHNLDLVGFIGGYDGLIDDKYVDISFDLLDGKINAGGSLLKSGRCPRFLEAKYIKKAVLTLKKHRISNLIVLGGDGSTRGAIELKKLGVNVIVLPCTIDNDMNISHTIGFNTAVNNVVNAVDNISDSLSAFNYGGVVKVMGRDCSDLVNESAKALHTDFVVDKADINIEKLAKRIKTAHNSNNLPIVVLVRENCVDCEMLTNILQEKCGFQFRLHILGYIQRGGKPTAFDRSYAYSIGQRAVEMMKNEQNNFALGLNNNKIVALELEEIIKK